MRRRCVGAFCIAEPTEGKYCAKHWEAAQEKFRMYSSLYEKDRQVWDKTFLSFYRSSEWKAFRLAILAEQPICQRCKKTYSNTVHHKIPLKQDWSLRLNKDNVESICGGCHSSHELTERNKR